MRLSLAAILVLSAVAVAVVPTDATARPRFRHHRHGRGAYHVVGRDPAYAPPAPIGVGLFGTGLFYGDVFGLGPLGF